MTSATDLQEQVQQRLDELAGTELGLQVAVYQNGELVVDAVAGEAVEPDTLFYSASTGKGATATVANVLVDRGVLEYDAPIADVWPEFAVHGKEKATLRHLLTHSVGLPALPPDTTADDLDDWPKITSYLAAAEPWWEPGTTTTYHAETFGYLVGEVVRRATGRSISAVLREIAEPLGIADEVYFGVPRDQQHRLSRWSSRPGRRTRSRCWPGCSARSRRPPISPEPCCATAPNTSPPRPRRPASCPPAASRSCTPL
ncbi:serine hydrolase domain-containing protein [Kribbella sp. NPDC002412]